MNAAQEWALRGETDLTDTPAMDFASTGQKVYLEGSRSPRWRYVYIPSQTAQAWDGVSATHALGTRRGGYSYALVRVTGRVRTLCRKLGVWGYRVQVTLNLGTEDEEQVGGWVLDPDCTPLAEIREALRG